VALGGTLIALPLTLLVEAPARESWPYILATVVVHVGYYVAIAAAYRLGDLSHAYPIMRGCSWRWRAASGSAKAFRPEPGRAWC
jgi:hypothetical protein